MGFTGVTRIPHNSMMVPRILLALALLAAPSVQAQSEMVIALEGTPLYHRPGCDLVRNGKNALAMTRAQAEARGLKPHAQCDPSQSAQNDPGGSPAAKPAMVLIDVDGKFYHRDKCAKLSKTTKRVTVTEASKEHWPCRTCKPPIRPRPRKG